MTEPLVQPRRLTRAEYHRLAEDGYFDPDERLELLDGEIVTMVPQGTPHAATLQALTRVLMQSFGTEFQVRVQLPLALNPYTEPEPDAAIVHGATWDFLDEHPTRPELVIEVSGTTLGKDRLRKAPLYARAALPEYWIIDLGGRTVDSYRDPDPAMEGGVYRSIRRLVPGDVMSPLARPEVSLAVRDLLPPT